MLDALFLRCYVEHIPRAQDVPPPRTKSAAKQLAAFSVFMGIEAERVAQAMRDPHHLVILDRSVDTLMAHAYALDHLFGFQVYGQVRKLLWELPYLRPDHTIYLDASLKILQMRRATDSPFALEGDYFLHRSEFLIHTREYFVGRPPLPIANQVTIVPADGPKEEISELVRKLVKHWSR
ncbi:hypothetical protein [Streptomyces sp. NPDC086519]|uniref:hypothetical protein n=1 Tax=Streptomyces sp. NPDC086519 TaxID=3154863 RepID=UPI00341EC498